MRPTAVARLSIGLICAFGFAATFSGCAAPGKGSPNTQSSVTATPPADEGNTIDWNHPLPNSIQVPDIAAAALLLDFTPVVPSQLGDPLKVLVGDPSVLSLDQRVLGLHYETQDLGAFWVIEEDPHGTTTEVLEQMAQQASPSASPPSGTAYGALVVLSDGSKGLLVTPNDPNGMGPTTLEWLRAGVHLAVTGPNNTFGYEQAVEAANQV